MKKLISLGAFAGFLVPLVTLAQSNLDGTWKVDMNQVRDTKPLVIVFQDGILKKNSSMPGVQIKADGQFHPVSADPRIDMTALKVIDARHLQIEEQKNGKIVATLQLELSADGNTTTETFSDSTASTTPFTGKVILERVAPAPPGSDPFSGSWRIVRVVGVPDNGLLFTFQTDGGSVHMTTPTGQSYVAKLDGTEAPYAGDPSVTAVSLKRIGPNTYEETDKLGDKVVAVARMTVSADGKTMSLEEQDLPQNRTFKYVAIKQ